MTYRLDFLSQPHILSAINEFNKGMYPSRSDNNVYWIKHNQEKYPFKHVVEVASSFTQTPIRSTDFFSSHSSRKQISALGFQIVYWDPKEKNHHTNYWVGASYYGPWGNQTDMQSDFLKKDYWRADHGMETDEGLKIYAELQKVQINDRICIRYLDRKGGTVRIAQLGTVSGVGEIGQGKLSVNWDYNPPRYHDTQPSGKGSGNWWKTFFQLKRPTDIQLIFSEIFIEKRAARLAWNENGWIMPSGPIGKSDNPETHEGEYGYGHEEWLFDTSKLINGYHYGFLEPVRKEQEAFSGKVFDVWLYSINGVTKKRYWVGEISELKVITYDEAKAVFQTYLEKGWITEMEKQIRLSGAKEKGFSNWKNVQLFNVKYKPENLFTNDPYYELSGNHPIYRQPRYTFVHVQNDFESKNMMEDTFEFDPSEHNDTGDGEDDQNPNKQSYFKEPKAIEVTYLHEQISKSLTKVLKQKHGNSNVKREHRAGYGANKIDIVVQDGNQLVFYEIKTYNSLKNSIREAFGQLMEYCFYPNKEKAEELVIVTQLPVDEPTKTYFKNLRHKFKIPIFYQSYDLESKMLSPKY